MKNKLFFLGMILLIASCSASKNRRSFGFGVNYGSLDLKQELVDE